MNSKRSLPPGVRRYLGYYRPARGRVALGVGLGLIRASLVLPIPLLVGRAIDTAIPEGDSALLVRYGLAIAGLALVGAAISMVARYVTATAIRRAIRSLRVDAVEKLFKVSRRYYSSTEPSVIHDQIVNEAGRVNSGTSAVLQDYVPGSVFIIGLGAVLVAMNATLAVVTLAFGPVIVLSGRIVARRVRVRIRAQHRAFERFSGGVLRLLRAMDLIRTHGAEESELEDLSDRAADLEAAGVSRTVWNNLYSAMQGWLIALIGTTVLILGGIFVIREQMTLGELISFYAAFALMRGPLGGIALRAPAVIEGIQSLGHLEELLAEPDVRPYTGHRRLESVGAVELKDVTFAYETDPVVEDVTFEVEPGRVTALVGPNGSGKSTLVNLILGFYRPDQGSLTLGGVDYSEVDVVHLRRSVGVVPQSPILLQGTVAENVGYGREDVSPDDVRRALSRVGAEFVDDLPDGMHTDIGAEGVFLSGGQRQRIAIARALVHSPELLVLDEPTNHLDQESIASVMHSIVNSEPRPSVLLVSHQTEALAEVDEIVELKAGRVVARTPGS